MLHGIDEAQNAEQSAKVFRNIDSANLPSIDLDKQNWFEINNNYIVLLSKLEKSKEIRRLIKSNG